MNLNKVEQVSHKSLDFRFQLLFSVIQFSKFSEIKSVSVILDGWRSDLQSLLGEYKSVHQKLEERTCR